MVLEYSCMAIVVCGNEILYTDETVYGKSRISIPKGHIEEGENHVHCAIRECEEETGVKLNETEMVKELDSYSYEFENPYNDNKLTRKTIYPMIFQIKEKRPIHITEININVADYMKVSKLIKRCTFPNVAAVLEKTKDLLNI